MWGARETRTGKIVYRRKKHSLGPADILRMTMRQKVLSDQDAGIMALVLIFAELALEDFAGIAGGGQNLAENYPLWFEQARRLSQSRWATKFNQLHPFEATTVSIVLAGWEALAAIKKVEEISSELTNP